MTLKLCTKCSIEKEAILGVFGKNSNGKDGLTQWCKECLTQYRASYVPRPKLVPLAPGNKVCRRCSSEKPRDAFRLTNKLKSGTNSWCLKCELEYHRTRYVPSQKVKKEKPVKEPKIESHIRECKVCHQVKEKSSANFYVREYSPGKFYTEGRCLECKRKKEKEYEQQLSAKQRKKESYLRVRARQGKLPRVKKEKMKVCGKCSDIRPLKEYANNGKCGFRYCLKCRTERDEKQRLAHERFEAKRPKIENGFQRCTKCGVSKPADSTAFLKSHSNRSGLSGTCKECVNQRQRKPSHLRSIKKPTKDGHKFCRVCDIEFPMERFRIHNRANGVKTFYHVCKKCEIAQNMSNPERRIALRIRGRVRQFLSKKKQKYSKTLGCSAKELREHIEKNFLPGMSWENREEWHIDHYYPLSKAYKQGPEIFAAACNYKNLRPIWKRDNMSKHAKIPEEFIDVQNFLSFIRS